MKKLSLLFFAVVACFVWISTSSPCEAARQKGKVTVVVKENTEICEAVKVLLPDRKEEPCEVEHRISNLVGLQGTLPGKLEAGQSVILKVKGVGKVMAKVVLLVESDATLNDLASAIIKEEADIVWRSEDGGSFVLLKTEKEFLPSEGDVVSLKVRSGKKMMEGC